METRYELIMKGGDVVYSSLTPTDMCLFEGVAKSSQMKVSPICRVGSFEDKLGLVRLVTNDSNLVKSSRRFCSFGKGLLDSTQLVHGTIEKLKADQIKNIKRAIHNLSSLNAHSIQEVYSFIPQDDGSQTFRARFKGAEKIVKDNTKDAAKTLIRVAQNNTRMKVELSVFSRLLGDNPILKPSIHKIHKVLINVFYVFFPDFTDKQISVSYGTCYKAVFVDYESIHAALYYIVENASKYAKNATDINVQFEECDNDIKITISMWSLLILPEEADTIFDEGVSGFYAIKTKKSGDGIGMNRAKKLIEHNQGALQIFCDYETRHTTENVEYQKLDVVVTLPKGRKGSTQGHR
ncbi:ATP-binding protein [Coraliomargarita sp. W4R72]